MKFPVPRTLSGQTLAVLVLAITVSHAIGLAIYAFERRQTVTNTEAHDFADRVVGMVNLIQRLPDQWRADIVRESDGRTLHVMLGQEADLGGANIDEELTSEVARYLRNQFPDWTADRVIVSLNETPYFERERILTNRSIQAPDTVLDVRSPNQSYDYLHISVRVTSDEWLNLVGALKRDALLKFGPTAAYIGSLVVAITLFSIWLVHKVTRPLKEFGRAADRLGKDISAEPLVECGPAEVSDAARAFNEMQERLSRLIQHRTEMLAAISHDLRTPVSLLRLRAEAIHNRSERTKLLATLDEMESMIASVLDFTRATVLDEPKRRVDLSALIDSICDDISDAGSAVECILPPGVTYNCRRMGLKRALTNLIGNAVKYGVSARVELEPRDAGIEIMIEDDGPGIPADQLAHVFMPFHRVEASRGHQTGGVGLGLSIAQTILDGHGGKIDLENRPEGGLRVRVELPA